MPGFNSLLIAIWLKAKENSLATATSLFQLWQRSLNSICTGLFISPLNILKIRNKLTTQRIMVVLTPKERETLQVFLIHISQMLNVSTFGNTADIYAIVNLVPHACQHITVDQSHSRGDTAAKICRLAGSGGTKTVSFTNPQKKNSHGVKSGDRGGHRINASSFPVRPIHLCGKFDWDTLARLCSDPENRLVERCNHYCLYSTVASASFLTCLTDLWITLYKFEGLPSYVISRAYNKWC